ncbi:MAG: LysR family transcriptional regulator [Pontixanthobacter sp.]
MVQPVNLSLLRTFVTIADCGSFSGAAKRLLRGQSAISLQIKRLEDQFGVALLERGGKYVTVTQAGEAVYCDAVQMLRLNDEMVARIEAPELTGSVRIGAPEDFATSHLQRVLSSFAHSHPRVTLEVTCELTLEVIERFAAGQLDLALIKREPGALSPIAAAGRTVWREPLVWAGAEKEDFARQDPLRLVASPLPCVYRSRAGDALRNAGRNWRVSYTCGSLAGSLAAVRAGLGLAVLPKDMVPADIAIVDPEGKYLPKLADTEIALLEPGQISAPVQRLRDLIILELERGIVGQ